MIIVARCRRLCSLLFYCFFSSTCVVLWVLCVFLFSSFDVNEKKVNRKNWVFNAVRIYNLNCVYASNAIVFQATTAKRKASRTQRHSSCKPKLTIFVRSRCDHRETHNLKCHKWAKIVFVYAWIIDLLSTTHNQPN